MKNVASCFGKERLCELSRADIEDNITALRDRAGDRAVLRALHFFDENERVEKQTEALEGKDTDEFLRLVTESGNSSFRFLQNVHSASAPEDQGTSLALYLSERFLKDKTGAARIQGGGFAGTIEAFIPDRLAGEYKEMMEKVFGKGSCHILSVRPAGAIKII